MQENNFIRVGNLVPFYFAIDGSLVTDLGAVAVAFEDTNTSDAVSPGRTNQGTNKCEISCPLPQAGGARGSQKPKARVLLDTS